MISIVVLTYNQLEDCTKPCIESIYKYTEKKDFELIVVDNDSKDETPDYLRSMVSKYENMKIILNALNKGYAGGNNDGIKASNGDYIILLNNDTLVSPGWLEQILSPFKTDPMIGMVGPVSNSVGNEQRINIPDIDENNYIEKAAEYITKNSAEFTDTQRLGFYCVALRKSAVNEVGLLDEKFGIGMFEDDDYCIRFRKAGFKLIITDGCFIYHKGSVSFKKLSTDDYLAIFKKNKKYFYEKHGVPWSYADLLLGHLNYCFTKTKSELISVRKDNIINITMFMKDIELSCDSDNHVSSNKKLMEISDWATKLKEELKNSNISLEKSTRDITELENILEEKTSKLERLYGNFFVKLFVKLRIIK